MKNMDKFAENLMDETLKEAAETFFGKRRELEDDLEFLQQQAEELQRQARGIEGIVTRLNHVLGRGSAAQEFWTGLDSSELAGVPADWEHDVALPRAWTRRGRFLGLVRSLYMQLAERIDVYTHGRYVEDKEVAGKKQLTTNLKSVTDFAESINAAIREINACNRPDDVMAFARSMDVEGGQKRKLAGSDLTYNFDQDLCFKELSIDDLGLAKYPELSTDRQSMQKVDALAKDIYSRYKKEIKDVLDEIYG
ncbi:conserved hypothetical protein [Desulfonatronospira thiodismutans ASO3-1]|uniref:Uncharacterized protein n=1 Tax=Desulfonatronospira thiodismutans ASO3-1 TaxID=555779 RepID=D6SKY4_9BACT|nr:hypothetical protein [Desulfonatronospira thiodismutans]EFI35345.1 conserved hypothetical protein [Desulfonatronospira thiodismutans ASO3-1]